VDARRPSRSGTWIAVSPVLSRTCAACATGGESLAALTQQLEDCGDSSAGEGQALQGAWSRHDGESEGSGNDGMGPVPIACLDGPVPIKRRSSSPSTAARIGRRRCTPVSATINPGSWCLFTIAGSIMTAGPCNLPPTARASGRGMISCARSPVMGGQPWSSPPVRERLAQDHAPGAQ
jgi:hypothetical protein